MKSFIYLALVSCLLLTNTIPALADNTFSCSDVTEIPLIECEALVALYNSTNGAGWTNKTNWLVTNTPSNWFGVTVVSGHVMDLDLSANGLSGSIPPELGNLTSLQSLGLSFSQLSGSIPPELGNLTNLTRLGIEVNLLSGSIPIELGNLTGMSQMNLSHNQLSGSIPAELGSLTSLTWLGLHSNQLSGPIPPELGNLTNLTTLWLNDNQLSGPIPPELGNLTSLKWLYLSSNQLSSSIPAELGSLTSLIELVLDSNQLSGPIPPELGNLTSLVGLDLSFNQLSGSIPTELGNLASLQGLDLSDNQLSGPIPSELGILTYLTHLYLDINLLSGAIPPELSNLAYLQYLDMDYNMLNVPPDYPDPSNPLHTFLSQKDPDWHTRQGFERVIGAGGGMFSSLDGRVGFTIPSGALNGNTTFTFMPQPSPSQGYNELFFLTNSFQLTAEDEFGNPVTSFNVPITVTNSYSGTNIGGLSEDTLGLYFWDGGTSTWLDAVTTCPGGLYTRDLIENRFSLPLCHLTEFGVFAPPLRTFIPMVFR